MTAARNRTKMAAAAVVGGSNKRGVFLMVHLCRSCHLRTDYVCSRCVKCTSTCCTCPPNTRILHVDSKAAQELIRAHRVGGEAGK